jgi:hypothetical protein
LKLSPGLTFSLAAAVKEDGEGSEKDETKIGAGTGKVVNMMSSDVQQVGATAAMLSRSSLEHTALGRKGCARHL